MAKPRRGSDRASGRSHDPAEPTRAPDESGGFLQQIGLAETGSGLSHGPTAIVVALLAALIVFPIGRLIRALRGRG